MKKRGSAIAVAAFVLVWLIISRGYIEWLASIVDTHISEFLGILISRIIFPYFIALPISYLIIAKKTRQPAGGKIHLRGIYYNDGCTVGSGRGDFSID